MSLSFAERYGPWAVVTGASSGIGQHFATLLAERGLNVVITARRKERLNQLAAELAAKHGVRVEPAELDLTQSDWLDALLRATANKDIGLLVSNAGFGFKGLHHEQQPAQLNSLLNVNALAPTLLAQAYASKLIQRGRGGILFTGSVEGFFSSPWSAAYAATKAYVHSLGEALWGELSPHGVDVLVLAPGATDTDNLKAHGFDAKQMSNVMSPRQVAQMALDHLRKGPTYVPGAINRAMVRFITLLPKRWAINAVGKGTKRAMDKARAAR